jgi:hypothetical protein
LALQQNRRFLPVEQLCLNKIGAGVQGGLYAVLSGFRGYHLELKANSFTVDAAQHLRSYLLEQAHRPEQQRLQKLHLGHNTGLGDEGIRYVMEGLCGGSLHMNQPVIEKRNVIQSIFALDLTDCHVGEEGALAIATAIRMNVDLGSLNLNDNDLGDSGVVHIANALKVNHQLTELYLDGNNITDMGLSAIAEALDGGSTNKLQKLSLNNNRILGAGVIDFAEALLGDTCVESVSLADNPLNMKAVESFTITLKMSKLKQLNLSFVEITSKEMEHKLVDLLCESFQSNCTVSLGPVSYAVTSLAKVQVGDSVLRKFC